MTNQRSGIPRLFVILSLALAGLMVLQVTLLKYAWDLKEQAFTRGVQSAVAATVVSLESREIQGSAFKYLVSSNNNSSRDHSLFSARWNAAADPPRAPRAPRASRVRGYTGTPRALRRIERHGSSTGGSDSLVVYVESDVSPDHSKYEIHVSKPVDLRAVVGDWITRRPAPIAERLNINEIREVLQAELLQLGIDVEPGFGVVKPIRAGFETRVSSSGQNLFFPSASPGTDSGEEVVLASDNITEAELLESAFRARLFPLDPFATNFDLVVAFPESRMFLIWQIWPLWLASILFITVIVFSFAKAWRTNTEQRRFADQLVDFINNMTHEFKTPISTVSLAGEALLRDDVREQPEVLARYTGMIIDENKRMHRQVDKILQMARFERGDVEFKKEPVDLRDLLVSVAASFTLQIENEGGSLSCDFQDSGHLVWGDRDHLESIFCNLVDNAMKYSPGKPQLKIGMTLADEFLTVKVSDRGLGISREDQRRVFEKYYRCPTGNRHDVKGYGLGLSFVASLVRAHDGYVELHSLLGQGTTVTVSLPVYELPAQTLEGKSP